MRRQVLFIQGGGAGAHEEDAKLAASLSRELGPDYQVRFPEMPNEADPDYAPWTEAIVEELEGMDDGAVVVGHSLGGSILIKAICEGRLKRALAGIFLVSAPFWYDHEVWRWPEAQLPEDASARLPGGVPLFLYHGRDDEIVPFEHLAMYAGAFPDAAVCGLKGRNHQLNEDLSEVARDIEVLG